MKTGMLLYAHVEPGRPPKLFPPTWGPSAYEHYQVPFYLDELRRVDQTEYLCWTPGVPYLALALDVLAGSGPLVLEEVGSTLFATIDKVAKLATALGLRLDPAAIEYRGIEVMPTMTWLAERLHPGYRVRHAREVLAGDEVAPGVRLVSKRYQASSYAFADTAAFARWVSRASFSLQGAFFARTGQERTVELLGNRVTLFDLDTFCEALGAAGCAVVPLASSPLAYDDAIDCDEIFFMVHRLSAPEWEALAGAAGAAGIARPQVAAHGVAAALRAAPTLPGRQNGFMTVAPSSREDGDAAFRTALDFYDPRIEDAFYEHLETASPTPERLAAAPVVGQLEGPFIHDGGHGYRVRLDGSVEEGDTMAAPRRSRLYLTEDGRPLGAPHAPHTSIRFDGAGRFSHWGRDLYMSASDNSDPNTNGRRYELRRLPALR
ncbi:MAG: hypothetical protein AB7H88_00860 [Vicinamibacterales bacterium]